MDIIDFLTLALRLAPLVVKAGEEAATVIARAISIGETKADPTDADWAALHALEAQLLGELDAAAKG